MIVPHCDLAKSAKAMKGEKTTWNVKQKRLASSHGIDP